MQAKQSLSEAQSMEASATQVAADLQGKLQQDQVAADRLHAQLSAQQVEVEGGAAALEHSRQQCMEIQVWMFSLPHGDWRWVPLNAVLCCQALAHVGAGLSIWLQSLRPSSPEMKIKSTPAKRP
eukprot:989501-Pelagomonas_calceolata.AAC.2